MHLLPWVGSERMNLQIQSGTLQRCWRWIGPLESSWKEMRDPKAPREDAYHRMHSVWASPRLGHWAARCLLLFWLLVYYPFTVPSPCPSLAEIKDSRVRRRQTGTPIVHNVFVSLITWEPWLCQDVVVFVCGILSQIFSLWFSGVSGKEDTRLSVPAPCGTLYLQWGHWLLYRVIGIFFVTEILATD